MIEYIYIVKCPGCEDEMFNFFTDARMQCDLLMSKKPSITQVEVERNDFGECTDSHDLGTVWSWEEAMKDAEGGYTEAEPAKTLFTKDDLKLMADGQDPEFDNLDNSIDCEGEEPETSEVSPVERKPIPEGMTIEQLVEEMEENEDTVECTWCNDLFDKSECRKEVDLGWLCSRCEMAIKSRGETLTFREGNYWDFLDEDLEELSFAEMVADSINHLINDLGKDSSAEDFADDVIKDIENNYDIEVPEDPEKYRDWASAVACEVSRQLNNQPQLDEELETKTWICEFDGKEIGTVEAVTEEEAYAAMEHKYYDYNYGLYDGVAMVYPADEDLTEASLSDIAAAANSEFGSSWDDDYLLDIAGVDDDFRSIDSFGDTLPKVRKARELSPEKIAEREAREIEREKQKRLNFAKSYVKRYGASQYNQRWAERRDYPYYDETTGEFLSGDQKTELLNKRKAAQEAELEAEYLERRKQPLWVIQYLYNKNRSGHLYISDGATKEEAIANSIPHIEKIAAKQIAKGKRFDWNESDIKVVAYRAPNSDGFQHFNEDVEPEALHDLGNEYDGGYPAETPEVSNSHLKLCPECGKETFDIETGICVDCGFN